MIPADEYQSLFEPGIHDMTLSEMESRCVGSFSDSARREQVFGRFKAFLSFLYSVPLSLEIWVDGSFTTVKHSPNDVDIVIFYNVDEVNQLADKEKATLQYLFADQKATRLRFLTDAYFVPRTDERLRSYWRGWYGFTRHEAAKGIVRIA